MLSEKRGLFFPFFPLELSNPVHVLFTIATAVNSNTSGKTCQTQIKNTHTHLLAGKENRISAPRRPVHSVLIWNLDFCFVFYLNLFSLILPLDWLLHNCCFCCWLCFVKFCSNFFIFLKQNKSFLGEKRLKMCKWHGVPSSSSNNSNHNNKCKCVTQTLTV